MNTSVAKLLKRTLFTVLDLPLIISRLLEKPDRSEGDLESQAPSSHLTFEDEVFPVSPERLSEDSEKTAETEYYDKDGTVSAIYQREHDDIQGDTPYAEGPTRIFLHGEGGSEKLLVLSVTKEMVSMIQEVTSHKQALRKHERLHSRFENQVISAERAIERAEDSINDSVSGDEAQKLQAEVEHQRLKMQKACTERDLMADRLRVFRLNVELSKNEAQTFFEQVLGDADLLDAPSSDSQTAEGESDGVPHSRHNSSALSGGTGRSSCPSPEELFRQAALENLIDQSRELRQAQNRFDTWPDECDRIRQDYDNCVANGEEVPLRSDLDLNLLQEGMGITSYLIQAEKEHEMAKEHAIAVGAVDENWGQPIYYGDEFEAQSWSDEEEIAHQRDKDWSRVEAWRMNVSAALDGQPLQSTNVNEGANGTAYFDDTISEPMDIDEWDAKTIDFAQDSVSVVDHDVCNSKNISRWQEITGHR